MSVAGAVARAEARVSSSKRFHIQVLFLEEENKLKFPSLSLII